MIGTSIFTGVVKVEPENEKVYLETNNMITDLNHILTKFTGEAVEIRITPPQD